MLLSCVFLQRFMQEKENSFSQSISLLNFKSSMYSLHNADPLESGFQQRPEDLGVLKPSVQIYHHKPNKLILAQTSS